MPANSRVVMLAHVRLFRILGLTTATALATAVLTTAPAAAESAVSAQSGTLTISGAGWGHGWGMSQYGAYGAARSGLSWRRILGFYYPGTTLAQQPNYLLRVWITADNDGDLRVRPSAGLVLFDASGHSYRLPSGAQYRAWRVKRSGTGYALSYLNASGVWVSKRTSLSTTTWRFTNTAKIVKVVMPSGSIREYRGSVALIKWGSGARTVNRLRMETYLKSVVPAEMPTSWSANAVRAQAVAARSYAAKLKQWAGSRSYHICDTTACQVYRGYAVTYRGVRTVHETANGNAAIAATARVIVTYQGSPAYTQFSSSNGGHSAQGDFRYLAARPDPYDGLIKSQSWSRSISATSIARIWPSVGTVRQLQVTARDGAGRWGGRVEFIKIIGSLRTLQISGLSFQRALGLRSTLFTIASNVASSSVSATAALAEPASVSATSFGARCDGVHDDRAALVKALKHLATKGGGTLTIPAGDCRIVQTAKSILTGVPANVTISGTGAASRILLACDRSNSYRELFRINGGGVRIENLSLVRSTPCSGAMIALRPYTNFTLSNVIMDGRQHLGGGTMHALIMPKLTGGTYRNISLISSIIKDFPGYGLLQPNAAVTATDGFLVDGCVFIGNRSDDLEFNAPSARMRNVTVQNSTFANNRSTGVRSGFAIGLANVQNALIAGNSFSNYRREPIHIEDRSADITIQDNSFENSSMISTSWASHIFIVNGSHNITISGNVFDTSANRNSIKAIFIGTGGSGYPIPRDVTINGNTFVLGPAGRMAHYPGVPNVAISGNTVRHVA